MVSHHVAIVQFCECYGVGSVGIQTTFLVFMLDYLFPPKITVRWEATGSLVYLCNYTYLYRHSWCSS